MVEDSDNSTEKGMQKKKGFHIYKLAWSSSPAHFGLETLTSAWVWCGTRKTLRTLGPELTHTAYCVPSFVDA